MREERCFEDALETLAAPEGPALRAGVRSAVPPRMVLEPMNCTADVKASVDVYVPKRGPQAAMAASKLP